MQLFVNGALKENINSSIAYYVHIILYIRTKCFMCLDFTGFLMKQRLVTILIFMCWFVELFGKF